MRLHHGEHGDTAIPKKIFRRVAVLAVVGFALSAAAAPVAQKKAELKELRGRIDTLGRELAKSEESKVSAAGRLRTTESTISDANRRLRKLGTARAEVRTELDDLERQTQRLARQTEAQQRQLARLMFRHAVRGDADALQLLVAGRDPNQAARDAYFLTLLSKAKADLIGDLRQAAAEKKRLGEAARDKGVRLGEIEASQQRERAALLAQRRARQTMLVKLADRIEAQRREIDTLRRDGQRLSQLIDKLARRAAAKPKATVKPGRRAAPPRQAPGADPASAGGAFAALKGKLRLPVKGEIGGRFGAKRAESGATWKGLFIRATVGQDVHAVAAGRVVFSDWLRGFGNLMIVDHGEGFLSVYGNNEALLRSAGETVKAEQVIATVGNSGDNAESGLYFELRHQGRVFDPSRWTRLR